MSRKKLYLLFILAFLASGTVLGQDKVSVEVINKDGTVKKVEFDWPFKGPPPVGSSEELIKKVDAILNENGIDCPPKREKVSDNIWKCGNGKKIRTDDSKLARLLSKAWD